MPQRYTFEIERAVTVDVIAPDHTTQAEVEVLVEADAERLLSLEDIDVSVEGTRPVSARRALRDPSALVVTDDEDGVTLDSTLWLEALEEDDWTADEDDEEY